MNLNTCRTCKHLIVRGVIGAPRAANYYCGHPERDALESPIADWTFNNKPNRCLPVKGASNCPGHAPKVTT